MGEFWALVDFLKQQDFNVGKDEHQLKYVEAMHRALYSEAGSEISVFIDAPAGTGKTTLATLAGIYGLLNKKIDQIIYIRAEVDVLGGKDRGALPGNDDEKNSPYQAPFRDAVEDFQPGAWDKWSKLSPELIRAGMKPKVIATHPGYFRGITKGRVFCILDEAQNLTTSQLKAIYTRFKNNCVVITTGHSGQCDIPEREQERVAGYLPFSVYALHHEKKGAYVGTLVTNYRGAFADWSDRLAITIKELLGKGEQNGK